MKMIKKIALAALSAALISTSVYAQSEIAKDIYGVSNIDNSGLFLGSAFTVRDPSSYQMDLINWKQMNLNKFYVFAKISSDSLDPNSTSMNGKGNLSVAIPINKNVLQLKWDGNLWAQNSQNTVKGLFGFGNMAISAGIGNVTTTHDFGVLAPVTVEAWGPSAGFGMTILPELGVAATFDMVVGSKTEGNYTYHVANPSFSVAADYKLHTKGTLQDTVSATFIGAYENYSTTNNSDGSEYWKASGASNILIPGYSLSYKFSDRFTYGLQAFIPFNFMNNGTRIDFTMCNGFSAAVFPQLLTVTAGLKTELPSLTFIQDQDVQKGNFTNTVSTGFVFYFTPEVYLGCDAAFDLTDGFQIDNDIWKQSWALSFTAKF